MKPGIYFDLPNETYHAGPGISKSGLWTLHTQSPAHYKFPPPRDEESTQAMAAKNFGNAAHIAVLEPNRFEASVIRGPADRRGNKWSDLAEMCKIDGKTLLVSDEYDRVLALRDAVHADAWINSIITGGQPMIEPSGYFIDPVTGELCRVRPDLYREDLGVIVDLKSALSAHPDAFARAVVNYGYHAQEAYYSDGWSQIGKPVEAFVFIAWEKKSPYAHAVYELPPSIVNEGRAVSRRCRGAHGRAGEAGAGDSHGAALAADVRDG